MSVNNLVLRRFVGEAFLIGGNVKVTLLRIKGDEAVFSVEAPREIPVNRTEIAQRILDTGKRLPVLVCQPSA